MKKLRLSRNNLKKIEEPLRLILFISLVISIPMLITLIFPFLLFGITMAAATGQFSLPGLIWGCIYRALPLILIIGGLSSIGLCDIQKSNPIKYFLLALGLAMIGIGEWLVVTMVSSGLFTR